jgi:hypothetical protein
MGTITRPAPVKLICGFIYSAEESYRSAKASLERRFSTADFESPPIPFTYTDHYAKEMGTGLIRRFCSFGRLIDPQKLAAIKILTNGLEEKLSRNKQRRVNIDPGYVDLAKLVLASTKNFRHRILISRAIYAEITLYYQDKSFRSGELTYPDYRTQEYIAIFNRIRGIYAEQITTK